MIDDTTSARAHPHADRLLDLVLGLLAPEARRETLEHLADCPPCEARFRQVSASHERARSRLAGALGGSLAGASTPARLAPAPRPRAAVVWLIAACLAAIAGVFVMGHPLLRPASRAQEAVAWLPPADPSVVSRDGSAAPTDSLVLAGLAAYERRDLATARRLLEGAHAEGAMEQVRRVYLANTLLRMGEAEAALELLRDLEFARLPEPWRGESRWALRVALAGTGHAASAESLSRVLAAEPGVVGDRARGGTSKRAP